jgi:hypothetical protein
VGTGGGRCGNGWKAVAAAEVGVPLTGGGACTRAAAAALHPPPLQGVGLCSFVNY